MLRRLLKLKPKPHRHKKVSREAERIAELSKSIAENDRSIAETAPLVAEAIKRTDEEYYKMRTKVGRARRRVYKVESDLFMRDLEAGFRGKR